MLRIIQALLTPSFRDLIAIPFSEASVSFENEGTQVEIQSHKNKEKLELSVSTVNATLSVPMINADELGYMAQKPHGEEMFEEYQLKFSDHAVFQCISKFNAPVFLGLERTHKSNLEAPSDFYYERDRIISNAAHRGLRAKRLIKGSLAAGLMETQLLIQDAYRRLKRIENKFSDSLRENILLSSFKYSSFTFSSEKESGSLLPTWMEQRQFLQRKQEIELALGNIGVSSDKIKNVLEEFFSRLEALFKSIDRDKKAAGIPVEWVINKAQIDRVTDLIKIVDDHKSKVDKLFSSINIFIASINSFYSDTGKSLTIDTVGQLGINRPDQTTASIEALSSGERQLLIIFAHLLFNEYGNRSNVFIIDEPELSLHLKWQERFVSKALEVSPKTQLILATHSPEIIGDYENRSINV